MTTETVDDELSLVRDAARGFLNGRGAEDRLGELAQLDWLGLLVAENHGGAGWLPVQAAVIAEELGRAGDRSPWLGTSLAAAALSAAPGPERDRWLPRLLAGSVRAAFTRAAAAVRVADADRLDLLIVAGDDGVDLIDPGVLQPAPDPDMLDVLRPVSRVPIAGAPSVRIGGPEQARDLLAAARILLAADSVGAVTATSSRLTDYLRDRRAFGAPIASFQAIQHRLVDLLVFEVKARAIVMKAARALTDRTPRAATLATVAQSFVAAHATAAVDECMQLSGGIGFTWEYPLHHELRRVFGNTHLLESLRAGRCRLADDWGWS